MSNINVNGVAISYPDVGDVDWGSEATNFAIQVAAALGKLGLGSGTTASIVGTLTVAGNTTLSANLTVSGNSAITGNETIGGTLGVTGNTTVDGVIYADDNTTANTPVISFIGDTNTGIGRSAADTLDLITNGNSRFRIESTGQIKAVYESTIGTDYNTTLDNGYLCRAWVNFNGTGTVTINASGNVSSITDNNVGKFTLNFTTALPDSNYCAVCHSKATGTSTSGRIVNGSTKTTTTLSIDTTNDSNTAYTDYELNDVSIFR